MAATSASTGMLRSPGRRRSGDQVALGRVTSVVDEVLPDEEGAV
jgi:hypothetical protein